MLYLHVHVHVSAAVYMYTYMYVIMYNVYSSHVRNVQYLVSLSHYGCMRGICILVCSVHVHNYIERENHVHVHVHVKITEKERHVHVKITETCLERRGEVAWGKEGGICAPHIANSRHT